MSAIERRREANAICARGLWVKKNANYEPYRIEINRIDKNIANHNIWCKVNRRGCEVSPELRKDCFTWNRPMSREETRSL